MFLNVIVFAGIKTFVPSNLVIIIQESMRDTDFAENLAT